MQTQIMKLKSEYFSTCDFCNSTSIENVIYRCDVCGKDFCYDHGTVKWKQFSDKIKYRYCQECDEIYNKYLPKINDIKQDLKEYENACYLKIKAIEKIWKKEALDK